ncbi:MAG: hypothetical protein JW860_08310 [Sedimentisphaerales bacterium]|nr:hypothetical protein [Sedimentisphaerales bacterium]
MRDNSVTYSGKLGDELSVRVPGVMVEVDGQPAPGLELCEVVLRSGPWLNEACFRVQPYMSGARVRLEDIFQLSQPGRRIVARLAGISGASRGRVPSWPLFAGVITRTLGRLRGDGEDLAMTAVDELTYHNRGIRIEDMRIRGDDGTQFIKMNDIIFNPGGKGNRSRSRVRCHHNDYFVFELGDGQGCSWNAAQAIGYIVGEYLTWMCDISVTVPALEPILTDTLLRDVEITGLNPIAAIERICQRCDLRFALKHIPVADHAVKSVLIFYQRGQGRKIQIYHQPAGEQLEASQTNLVQAQLNTDTAGKSLQLTGRGSIKRFESTFELVEGWDQSLEASDYNLYSAATNDDFVRYRDVFRKFVLNEAGDYEGVPFHQGPAYDLSVVLGTIDYARRRRRFYPCLSRNASGESFCYYVEVSYNGGTTWQIYEGAFNILLNECGIYLSSNQLDGRTWIAICKDKLRFRITACIDGDEALEAKLHDGPIRCARPLESIVIHAGDDYQYRRVTGGSIFRQNRDMETALADEIDDSGNLRRFLREHLARLRQEEMAGILELNFLRPDISPGDIVKEIRGRDIDFGRLGGSSEFLPQVEQVELKLGEEWITRLTFGG